MKQRLIAGTINHWPDVDGWHNWTIDISNRPIYSESLNVTVQPDFVCDIAAMPIFRDEMFNEVRAHHVLEHLAYPSAVSALNEFHRILVPGGILDIEVPDIDRVITAYAAGELDQDGLAQWLYGEQLAEHEPGDSHRWPWTELTLSAVLLAAGFTAGDPLDTGLAVRFRAERT